MTKQAFWDYINPFNKPSANVLAVEELEEALRQLLKAQSALDYSRRLTEYHQDRIKRLRAFLKAENTNRRDDYSYKPKQEMTDEHV